MIITNFFYENMGLVHGNLLSKHWRFLLYMYLTFTDVTLDEEDTNRNQETNWKVLSPNAIQVRQDLVVY